MSNGPPVDSPISIDPLASQWWTPPPGFQLGQPAPLCLYPVAAVCQRRYRPGPQRFACMYRSGCLPRPCLNQFSRCMETHPSKNDPAAWAACGLQTQCSWAMNMVTPYWWRRSGQFDSTL